LKNELGGSTIKNFFFDLDDTLIDSHGANQLGLRKAYQKLSRETEGEISSVFPYPVFEKEVGDIYSKGKYFEYEPEVFLELVHRAYSKYRLPISCSGNSMAARLFQQFKQAKNNVLMPMEHAFDLLSILRRDKKSIFCITKGKCHYQHTKLIITNLDEDLFDSLIVVEKEKNETKESKLSEEIRKKSLKKQETAMIGDRVEDVVAGKRAGVFSIRIRQGKYKSIDPKSDEETGDMEFASIKELLDEYKKGSV